MDITSDELLVLKEYRNARELGHADLELSVKDHKIVKLHVTKKVDLAAQDAPLREVPR